MQFLCHLVILFLRVAVLLFEVSHLRELHSKILAVLIFLGTLCCVKFVLQRGNLILQISNRFSRLLQITALFISL